MNGELLKTLSYNEFNLEKHSILLGYRGSIVHGTYIPKSNPESIDDKDVMGICIPPKEYYFGLKHFEQYEKFEGEWDVVIYSLQKVVNLMVKNNPNVLNLLWLKDHHYILRTGLGNKLIENRKLFSSKLAYKSFCGYAYGQLHRMTHGAQLGYMGEKRKNLVKKYGYDCKNASHCIRILNEGIEFLSTGELTVERPEKSILIEIKKGLWTLEQVVELAKEKFTSMEYAYLNSKLPDKPSDSINNLLIELTEEFFK